MHAEIDQVKIVLSCQEAQDIAQEMNELFRHFSNAVNAAGGPSTVDQLMLDYPTAAKFFIMMKIYKDPSLNDLPF